MTGKSGFWINKPKPTVILFESVSGGITHAVVRAAHAEMIEINESCIFESTPETTSEDASWVVFDQ
jgi:hypothetical protein